MKKILGISLAMLTVLFLSGCNPGEILLMSKKSGKLPNVGSIWKSSDGGGSFQLKVNIEAPPLSEDGGTEKKKTKQKPAIITADVLAITFHPQNSNIIYIGTVNSGIFKTENGGELWKHIDFPPKRIDSFTLDKSDPDNKMFASGIINDTGKILRTDDGGKNWREVYTEPGQKTLITAMSQHSTDTQVIFAGTSGGTVIKSTDGGNTWRNIGQNIQGKVTALPFDSTLRYSVYALVLGRSVFYSKNGGEEWIDWEEVKKREMEELREREQEYRRKKETAKADSVKEKIQALEKKNSEEKTPNGIVSIRTSPFISGTIYAGTQRGELYRSADYGKYWEKINIIESASKFPIRMITLSHVNKNEVSFVAGTAFYKSINGGVTWAVVHLSADRPISAISYDPKDSNIIYLGLSQDYDELKR